MLEGIFCVVKSSPVSAERATTWRVYEAYDFASPIAYMVESVTVRRSSITKDLEHNQIKRRRERDMVRTSGPEQPMTKVGPPSSRRCDVPYDRWSRHTDLSSHD